jgi:hypothetical protein
MKLEFELDQRDMGLKEIPGAEQIYDFSLLDELARRQGVKRDALLKTKRYTPEDD